MDSLMNAMTFARRFFEENFEILPGAKPASTRRSHSAGPGKRTAPRRKFGKTQQGKTRRLRRRPVCRPEDASRSRFSKADRHCRMMCQMITA
ncbi:hypothetical protein [Hyalangium sp.]|uniref:hypothetical protein n=1 Tax=Hyalangium sp. TaxID=2028555 RepID=UPI002D4A3C2A|nr:hypothetical protein [Hyalangium sp.]HYH96083.1 hypothetical protein [Hyalangium sp.]